MNNPLTHNGIFTVTSVRTGQHRTFKVYTPQQGKLKGMRIASLLTGPDNAEDYTAFAFVSERGINIWKNQFMMRPLVAVLENLPEHERRGAVRVMASVCCRRCNRQLTTPESVESGIGPECKRK